MGDCQHLIWFSAALTCVVCLFMLSCVPCFGSSDRATQPFPRVDTPTGCFSLSRRGSVVDLSWKLVSADAAPS